MNLASKKCIPCEGSIPPLTQKEANKLLQELGNGWTIIHNHHLEKEYRFPNFKEALFFTNHVGKIAETEGHHPEIHLAWGRVKLAIWTHKIDGLTESDFILAAKCDEEMSEEIVNKALF